MAPEVFFDIKFGSGTSGLGSGREAQGALVAGNMAAAGMVAPWFPGGPAGPPYHDAVMPGHPGGPAPSQTSNPPYRKG